MADGRILKPSAAATTVDATFGRRVFGEGAHGPDGEVWTTHSAIVGMHGHFGIVLAAVLNSSYSLGPGDFSPRLDANVAARLDAEGVDVDTEKTENGGGEAALLRFVAYSYTGRPEQFSENSPLKFGRNEKTHPVLKFVAPVLKCGLAILGERAAKKFVPVSPQRFVKVCYVVSPPIGH
jgi:hypothetical protein